jgi:hypothetical protein
MMGRAPFSAPFPLDFPNQGLTLLLVLFHRLPIDHFVELRTTVFIVVAFRSAYIVLIEDLVGLVDPVAGQVERIGLQ